MTKLSQGMRLQIVRLVILTAVIASLCFSVGEGLRLTPFYPPSVARVEATNLQLDTKGSHDIAFYKPSLYKYGPLDVPTQTQKRSKRQAVDFACPPSARTREIPTCRISSPEHEPFHIVSVVFVSPQAGRAPPSVS
jgi:hypothetical protein